MKLVKCCGKGRVRRSMLSAFGIRTNVICDLCLQKCPGNSSGPLPASVSLGGAIVQKPLGRGRMLYNKCLESLLISRKRNSVNFRRGSCAPCLESASWTPWWHDSPNGSREVKMFWQLLPGPVTGGQAYEVVPLTSNEKAQITRNTF